MENCPKCQGENNYFDGTSNICPDCGYEWGEDALHDEDKSDNTSRDSNGEVLADGDSVTVIKDLPVKGSSMVVKRGTKVKNIRLTDDFTHIEGKVEGSSIYLKTEFLKKS
ncbi:MAG: alkylphosphonate utilization protein [Bacteroidales bacterium]|nr:alkylphosphonate utilization protein [Bacteroidales bacterium]